MAFIQIARDGGIATVTIKRGKVNALNEALVDELHDSFASLQQDTAIRAIVLTGQGKFFSFGFDIPEFLSYPRDDFRRFLKKFTDLYTFIFQYPKPVVAAINGHAIAGGCMLANACDHRIMVSGKAKISLNELSFGSSVFAGSVEILRFLVGSGNAQKVLISASMYSAEEARAMGLLDDVVHGDELSGKAVEVAAYYAGKAPAAFASIKRMLRQQVVESYRDREDEANEAFLDIWYSESTWSKLQEIKIRE
jgi:enoyl-CoA hydratase/carnithine racemase